MPCRNVTMMCTELAIAMVRIIVGADADGGEIGKPMYPPSPIAARIEQAITSKVRNVPLKLFVNTISMSNMTPKLIGTNLAISPRAASPKALFIMIIPLM